MKIEIPVMDGDQPENDSVSLEMRNGERDDAVWMSYQCTTVRLDMDQLELAVKTLSKARRFW